MAGAGGLERKMEQDPCFSALLYLHYWPRGNPEYILESRPPGLVIFPFKAAAARPACTTGMDEFLDELKVNVTGAKNNVKAAAGYFFADDNQPNTSNYLWNGSI